MSKRSRTRGLLARLLFNNFWLKAISLFCALTFYSFIHSAEHAQRTLKVVLVAAMPPPEAARSLVTKLPATVDVTIAGPQQQIEDLRGIDIDPVPLDLTQGLDAARIKLTPAMITGLAPSIRVIKIVPPLVETRFEDEIPRQIAVRTKPAGKPAVGMELKDLIKLEPSRVVATGPRSAVEVLQVVLANDFDINGLGAGSHERKLALAAPPPGVRYEQNSVRATLEIQEQRSQIAFKKVPVDVVGLKRATVRPTHVEVFIDGPSKIASAVRQEQLLVYVNPKKDGEDLPATGKELFDVKLVLEGLDVKVSPKQVLVTW